MLAVCTANLCRSPLLERVLGARLADRFGPAGPVRVASAGTRARVGVRPPETVEELVADQGGDPSGMRSRPLTAEMVREAALVLTATREHRADVVRLEPRALSRTFTVPEFARLLGGMPTPDPLAGSPLAAVVAAAAVRRGTLARVRPAEDDVPDPVGGNRTAFEQVLARILPTVTALTDALAQVGSPAPHR